MINKAIIIPTGDEILNGTVVDTNSPAIMSIIIEKFPACCVKRVKPVIDAEECIIESLEKALQEEPDLIILIGGTGGGHRHISTLAKDFTHGALMRTLTNAVYRELIGYNGHLWSKLVCGEKNGCIIVNVPGPYEEATQTAKTLVESIADGVEDLEILVNEAAKTLEKIYKTGGRS